MRQVDDDLEWLLARLLLQSEQHVVDEQVAVDFVGLEAACDVVEDGIARFRVASLIEIEIQH